MKKSTKNPIPKLPENTRYPEFNAFASKANFLAGAIGAAMNSESAMEYANLSLRHRIPPFGRHFCEYVREGLRERYNADVARANVGRVMQFIDEGWLAIEESGPYKKTKMKIDPNMQIGDKLDFVKGKGNKKTMSFLRIMRDAADLMGTVALDSILTQDFPIGAESAAENFKSPMYRKTIKGLRDLYTKGVAREQVGAIMQYIQEGFYRIEESAYKSKK